MLTADLVNARRRGNELHLASFDAAARLRACALAETLIAIASAHVGGSREELSLGLAAVDVGAREYRLRDGLAKLIEDRCEFDASDDIDPEAIRCDVFTRASAVRAELQAVDRFDRAAVISAVARARGVSEQAIERGLFADLRGAHVLTAFDAPSPAALVTSYERGQAQAVLLRAVKVSIDVRQASPGVMRSLFRRLKFLRLLHTIEKHAEGYRIEVDGPFALFESGTKYGLQLALALPALEECEDWRLEADVRWGKERTPLVFRLAGTTARARADAPQLPDEVQALATQFTELGTNWKVSPNIEILELPGIGMCVPDLAFTRPVYGSAEERVYLEVMGYWSRAAVWKRVELIQAGLGELVLFAVSTHLRVSEEVLDGELPGALYVYKHTMSARTIAERLELLARRSDGRLASAATRGSRRSAGAIANQSRPPRP